MRKCAFRRSFQGIGRGFIGPWMSLRNFNVILKVQEKLGGLKPNWHMRYFQKCFNNCQLMDFGFKRQNLMGEKGPLKEHLGKGVCNNEWRFSFIKSSILYFPPLKLDHCPI